MTTIFKNESFVFSFRRMIVGIDHNSIKFVGYYTGFY